MREAWRCDGDAFGHVVVNVVDVFCFVDGREANLAETEAVGTPPMEWTLAMGGREESSVCG